jgi:lipid-A-disaccharide synthase-like uncharacterized protein
MIETSFVTLYPLAAFCHVAAYLPQIKALAVNKSDVTVMPISPWIVWLGGNFVTLGYAVFHLKDLMLSITVSVTALLISMIILLIIYNRHKYPALQKEDDDIWNTAV